MELRGLEIWETGRQKNNIIYNPTAPITKYSRYTLADCEDFLRENELYDEADKIKKHLGKILKLKNIPKLIPTGNYEADIHLKYLKERTKTFVEEYGLQLDPDFQRCHVWDIDQRIRFVEFILQGGKTNTIYFNQPSWMCYVEEGEYDEFVIVDGKQRLTSLLMFLDNKFPVFKNLDNENIGYYAKDFDTFGYVSINYTINDLKSKKQVYEWYLSMNRGNIAHTEEELQKVENMLTNL